MPLDPDLADLLGSSSDAPPLSALSLEAARAITRGVVAYQGEPVEVAEIRDLEVDGEAGAITIRLYRPYGAPAVAPVLTWMHAGGFVRGDLDTWDIPLRDLADRLDAVVASVDYRLAPETRFPGALHDVLAALRHLASDGTALGIDPSRIAIGGDSAGGTLAAAAALAVRDLALEPRLTAQVLLYPPIDPATSATGRIRHADGRPLSAGELRERDDLRYLWDLYLPSSYAADHPYAAPLRAASLADLPPAVVATAEYDLLRDEGERYAARLAADGVPVSLRRFEGMVHSFLHFTGRVPAARALPEWLATTVRPLLHPAQAL